MSHCRLHPDLPIFAIRNGGEHALYVPGRAMPASPELLADLKRSWMSDRGGSTVFRDEALASHLVAAGRTAVDRWEHLFTGCFDPTCLNVQLPYVCNLQCVYCYVRPTPMASMSSRVLHREAVLAAAELVARNCVDKGSPFRLVIHGLGEPCLRWDDLQWCVEITRSVAAAVGISWFAHLSTNGQISCDEADWVGATFNHVTVSCDGPPDVQDAMRPRRDGLASSACLHSTIEALTAHSASVEVRATVTSANARRLDDIVRYCVLSLGVRTIRLELLFARGEGYAGLPVADELAMRFMHACATGRDLGADVIFNSPRLTELHGAYCDTQRQTLRLMPDGKAVNCLFGVCGGRPHAVTLGDYTGPGQPYEIDTEAANAGIRAAFDLPAPCTDCINIYHCARTCPDLCPALASRDRFNCRLRQALTEAIVLQAVRQTSQNAALTIGVSPVSAAQVRGEVRALPEGLNRGQIFRDTLRASRYYDLFKHAMPEPVWKSSQRLFKGASAQEMLWREGACRHNAISVYIHIPYCRHRCLFCDCHSVVAGHARTAQYTRYIRRVITDLEAWFLHGNVAHRRVSTVHFGGGTPDVIGYRLLRILVQAVTDRLAVDSDTEWAIETTSQGCSKDTLEALLSLGFKRLHVGVQTLDDCLRRSVGRNSNAEHVITHLKRALGTGMVTSVDLMYGLPGQTADSLVSDITSLSHIGIHGISLYRLNLSEHNQALLRRFPAFRQNPLRDCITLQAAEQCLAKARYVRNHHVHYALPPDRNLYFRHAIRGEDLLALGASAAGVIGSLEYVCDEYPSYLLHDVLLPPVTVAVSPAPATVWESRQALSLMCGEASAPMGTSVQSDIFQCWLRARLVKRQQSGYRLTALGAWLLSTMLQEMRRSHHNAPSNEFHGCRIGHMPDRRTR